jgi:hypothetical protein
METTAMTTRMTRMTTTTLATSSKENGNNENSTQSHAYNPVRTTTMFGVPMTPQHFPSFQPQEGGGTHTAPETLRIGATDTCPLFA